MNLNEDFWDDKYQSNQIGWDLGEISPPLKAYFDQLTNKELRVLIPGGGNSYEAEYLHQQGFTNVFVVDVSKTALENFKKRVPTFPNNHLLHQNFFDINLTFDMMIEQTFFCAISPKLRAKYAKKASQILTPKGKIVGLMFGVPLNENHPPFGGNKKEYLHYFTPYFTVKLMEDCYNSIQSRKNKELFVNLVKK